MENDLKIKDKIQQRSSNYEGILKDAEIWNQLNDSSISYFFIKKYKLFYLLKGLFYNLIDLL